MACHCKQHNKWSIFCTAGNLKKTTGHHFYNNDLTKAPVQQHSTEFKCYLKINSHWLLKRYHLYQILPDFVCLNLNDYFSFIAS